MIISVGHLDRPELPYVNTSSLGVINLPFLKTFTYFLKINAVRRLQSVKRYGRLKSYPIVLIIHSFCSVELTKSWNTWCLNSSGSEELECEHCAIPPEVNNLRSARSSNSSFLFLNTIEQSAGKSNCQSIVIKLMNFPTLVITTQNSNSLNQMSWYWCKKVKSCKKIN